MAHYIEATEQSQENLICIEQVQTTGHFDRRLHFPEKALKLCMQIFDETNVKRLADLLPDCDCLGFASCAWYKFTKKETTKENAIRTACAACSIAPKDVTAFGDDVPDIGMLKLCGTGIAIGNALDSVRKAADLIIGSNDEDGIAEYLLRTFL